MTKTQGSEDTPLVTAVMIFLNGEKYIAEAIESILAQSYTNWELVLVDDGSSDGATAIAQDFCRLYPDRIRYIDHPGHQNLGMSASRNAGVRAGTGSLVSFLDADDIWLPDRLDRFVAITRDHPTAGMAYGPTLYWYSWAQARGEAPPVKDQEDFAGRLDLPTDELIMPPVALRQFLVSRGGSLPGICSLIIRREAYEKIGGFEESFRGLYEDQVFLSKMTLNYPIVVIDDVLDQYRQHSESCCYRSQETGDYHPDDYHPSRGIYLAWLEKYLARSGICDQTIDRAVRQQLRPYRWPIVADALNTLFRIARRGKQAIRQFLPKPVTQFAGRCLRYARRVVSQRDAGRASL